MELTTWIIGWVAVTTVVVVLGYVRMTIGLHDMLDLHLGAGGQSGLSPEETQRGARLKVIDRIGIPLTVISALMMLVIVFLWAIESAGGR